jgi:ribosomal protein L21E
METTTIVLHEVYRWVDREGGELAASRAMATMQTGTVMDLDTDLALTSARLARQHHIRLGTVPQCARLAYY